MNSNRNNPTWVEYPQVGYQYYHYKGGLYRVLTLATHTETRETMVVYKSENFGTIFVRPFSEWSKDIDGMPGVKRFEKIADSFSAANY